MKKIAIGSIVGLVLLFGGFWAGSQATAKYLAENYKAIEKSQMNYSDNQKQPKLSEFELYLLVNKNRVEANLKPLKYDPTMCELAQVRLDDMHNNWSHDGFFDRAGELGVYGHVGENAAKFEPDEESTVKGWMESQSHKENILMKDFKETCIATGYSGYAVQVFSN